jgi:phosphoglycerate dehydrogenase-like enzyme
MPNVLLTPHTAGYSEDSMADNHRQSIDKVLGFLDGRWPDTALNSQAEAGGRARARAFVRG